MREELLHGMEEIAKIIKARNLGEKQATISFYIYEITILGETRSVEDGIETPESLWDWIQSAVHPFRLTVDVEISDDVGIREDGIIEPGVGTASIKIALNWPFERRR